MNNTGFALLVALNVALASLMRGGAPSQPVNSDRVEYEYAGRHPLEPGCPHDVYCYRILVPVVLERLPGSFEAKWRTFSQIANAAAGIIVGVITAGLTTAWQAPLLASLIAQMSFGFTMTSYDPYSPDPFVFVVAAAMAWLWLRDRPWTSLAVASIAVFGKETAAVVAAATACAALLARRPSWRVWILQAAVPLALVLGFHWFMEHVVGWSVERNQATKFLEGSWIAVWLANMDSPRRIVFLLFIPFGFAWAYAVAGFRQAPQALRTLALGTLLPVLALNYVQNPERALGNAFFVIAPLAALFLSRVSVLLAFLAAIANGLLTAKVGLSTTWLPSSSILLIPAALSAGWVLWKGRIGTSGR